MFDRYVQQIKIEQIGFKGQHCLQQARVLCIGAGGLGSSLLLYLAGAGVGTLGVVDDDVLEESNLQRQVLYQQQHLGQGKALNAKIQLQALNPSIEVEAYDFRFNRDKGEALIAQYDVVADCTDNFSTRYLIHELCYSLQKPYVYASAYQFLGHCSFFYGKNTPCLGCLFPSMPKHLGTCQGGGVLGVLPGLLGIVQASEILKWLLGLGDLLQGRLLLVDVLKMKFQEVRFSKQPDCPLCAGWTYRAYNRVRPQE